jgi:phosphoglucosamine mutase
MTSRLFGTDGVRGHVNAFPMLPDVALRLGLAAGMHFRKDSRRRHRVVIGKDTRLSGYIYEYALASGLCAAGIDVFLVGPLPTPAVAFLTRNMRADFGIVISASHNPYDDNGIKFFDGNGFKLADDVEDSIAAMAVNPDQIWIYPASDKVGRAFKVADAPGRYIVALKNSFPSHLNLDGMRVVIDCANGANYKIAPMALEELGAEVITLGVSPDGMNINKDCGALYPGRAADLVTRNGADIGLALDGDADRLIVVDETGYVLDGDQIMALCAEDMLRRNELPGNKLVATVMSNMALEVFMRDMGGELLRTNVGDRYVVEAMREHGALLGGEQSGHLVFMQHNTTGDGLLAGLQILRIMRETGKKLSELAGQIRLFPQILLNVKVETKKPFETLPKTMEAVKKVEGFLGDRGRVLLRYSGTESLARVMVEGEDDHIVKKLAEEIASTIEAELR